MALIVQQEPPVDGANSYAAVAAFKEYHSVRGVDLTPYGDPEIEFALIKATQYLDVRFEYVGYQYAKGQTTEWPRSSAYDKRGDRLDGIPTRVVWATCEYALRALATDLLADPDRDSTGRAVKSKSEQVGPIAETVVYQDHGGFQLPAYPLADMLLKSAGLVVNSGARGISVGDVGRA